MSATPIQPAATLLGAPYPGGPISPSRWGKDHWSTLAYLETCCVDRGGWVDGDRMRIHRRHPKLAGVHQRLLDDDDGLFMYATILRDGSGVPDHDDWDCLLDLCHFGLVTISEVMEYGKAGVRVRVSMTESGLRLASLIRAHKAGGGSFATFVPDKNHAK